jgi:hypothetical protein
VSSAARAPWDCGAKATVKVRLLPAARLAVEPVTMKSPGFAPPMLADRLRSTSSPVLSRV